jgi:hypothetical protein
MNSFFEKLIIIRFFNVETDPTATTVSGFF